MAAKSRIDKIRSRPGWEHVLVVRDERIVEIKPPLILQPLPAALPDGVAAVLSALQEKI